MTGALTGQLRTGRWQLAHDTSSARFTVRNFGAHRVSGQIPIVAAWADIGPLGQPVRAHAELDLTQIDTGNPRRDHDLRKSRVLGTDRFPSMTFTATAATRTADGWQLPGRLEAHGRAVDLTLLTGRERSLGPDTLTVHATAEFDRRALGITAPRILMGRRITVTIEAAFHGPR